MMRKAIRYFIVVIGAAALIGALYLAFGQREKINILGGTSEPAPQVQPGTPASYPQGDLLEIGTEAGIVMVKNFYKTAQEIVEQTEIVLEETQNYLIVYRSLESKFDLIFLSANSLSDLIRSAEESLLDKLGVSPKDACKLKVAVNVPYGADPAFTGGARRLSFCPPAP